MDEKEYQSKKKPELVQLCKDKGLPVSGNKNDLIARLLGQPPAIKESGSGKSKEPKKTKIKGLSSHSVEYSNKAIEYARRNTPFALCIKRNTFGNFEHPETHLVFHPETKQVIGKQEGNKVVKLSFDDVKICQEYKFNVDMEQLDGEIVINETSAEERYRQIVQKDSIPEEVEDFEEDDEDEEA